MTHHDTMRLLRGKTCPGGTWLPDSAADACMACDAVFTLFRPNRWPRKWLRRKLLLIFSTRGSSQETSLRFGALDHGSRPGGAITAAAVESFSVTAAAPGVQALFTRAVRLSSLKAQAASRNHAQGACEDEGAVHD